MEMIAPTYVDTIIYGVGVEALTPSLAHPQGPEKPFFFFNLAGVDCFTIAATIADTIAESAAGVQVELSLYTTRKGTEKKDSMENNWAYQGGLSRQFIKRRQALLL